MAGSVVSAPSGGGRHRRRRRAVMSEINVTPFVDVMLVLLIVFMVSAPLLTVGVPLDLPQSQAKSLDQDNEPLTVSVNVKGQVFLQDSEIKIDELVAKLKAVTDARGGADERIYVRGDKKVDYGTMMRVMGRLSAAGFHRVALVTEVEQGGVMRRSVIISSIAHVVVLGWGLVAFAARPSEAPPVEALPVEFISANQFSQLTARRQERAEGARKPEAAGRQDRRAEAGQGAGAEGRRQARDQDRSAAAAAPPNPSRNPSPKSNPSRSRGEGRKAEGARAEARREGGAAEDPKPKPDQIADELKKDEPRSRRRSRRNSSRIRSPKS